MNPLVSVIFPLYNGANYLREAIDSVLNQTYRNFELLIIDDGSTDTSTEIVLSYNDPRIRLLKNEKNLKIVKTLNRGVKEAKGEFIARMDADDICLPERFKKQVDYLVAHPDVTLIDTIMEHIDENGKSLNKYNSTITSESDILKAMAQANCLGHSSIMMRTEVCRNYLYRATIYEDDDLWLRLINDGKKINKIAEPLLLYRVHDNSIMQKDKSSLQNLKKLLITRWYYYSNLKFTDKFKQFNMKVLFWIVANYGVLNYKKLKQK